MLPQPYTYTEALVLHDFLPTST